MWSSVVASIEAPGDVIVGVWAAEATPLDCRRRRVTLMCIPQ